MLQITFRRAGRVAAAALGAAALALVGASAAAATPLLAYVSNATKDVVTPINLETNEVETGINVGAFTSSIAITPNGDSAYVPVLEGESLIPVNLLTAAAGTSISLTTKKEKIEPEDVAITPNGDFAYVADEETNNVKEVEIATGKVVNTIPVGEEPEGIAITPNGEDAYVADKAGEKQGTVTVIEKASTTSAKAETKKIDIGTASECLAEGKNPAKSCVEPEKIAIDPTGKFAYVAEGAAGAVAVIEIAHNEVVKTITGVGGAEVSSQEPDNIAITPNGATAYAVDGAAGNVVPINLSTDEVGTPISVGTSTSLPHGIAITPNGESVVVANEEEGKVKTIATATNTVAETFSVEGEPDGVGISTMR